MRSRASLLLLPLVALVPGAGCDDEESPAPVELASPAARVTVELAPFRIHVKNAAGAVVLSTLPGGEGAYGTPGAARDDGIDGVRLLPGWDGYVPDEKAWSHGGAPRVISQSADKAAFSLSADRGTVDVEVSVEGAKVRILTTARGTAGPDAKEPGSPWNKAQLSFALRPDEHFFGLGERFATVDHRGHSLYSWPEEGGLGKGEAVGVRPDNPFPNGPSMTYFPVPFFLSSAGYAVHLATTYRTETHFGSERPDAWRIAANTTSFETVVYVHDDPLASLDDFTRDTGRPMIPATWVFGPSRRVSYDNKVDGVPEWQMLRKRKVPTTRLDDAVHFLPAKSQLGREDDLRAWTTAAHGAGYKVAAYNNSHVAIKKDSIKDDLAFGTSKGYFVKTPEGAPATTEFISGELLQLVAIDLTNPEASRWFESLLERALDLGYDGWMHDFGEYMRRPWRFADGRNGEAVHNEYPVLSAKAAHEVMERRRPGDYVFFVRSGYTGTQKYAPAVWGGDSEATFDDTQGIPSTVRAGLNLGMSGVSMYGSDTTGFKCITDAPNDKEVYLRWAEASAVVPFMIEQNACSNPIGPAKTKWRLWNDDETIAVYSAMARLHTRLAPYFEVLIRQANQSGTPIMRHPFLLHPKDPEAQKAEFEYYLGPSLWAAPVVRRGARTRDTWLPPGKWVDFDDRTVYEGGRHVVVPAPLGKLPLLLADGGIVPMLDASIDTLAPATDPTVVTPDTVKDRLDVVVALSAGREAKITLADGTTLLARRGAAGAASGLPVVAADAVASCTDGCVAAGPEGGVDRLRVTTPLGATSAITHEDVTLEARGPSARRVRWDVARLR